MTLPASGPISLNNVNVELGLSGTTSINMNQASVRTLFGVPSGAISMSNGYGKANQFSFTISSSQTNANLRTLAVNAGWNQSSKVVATINGGVYISSNSTGTPALTVNGSFPGGVDLINNGIIVGMGGNGGKGRGCQYVSGFGIFYVVGSGGSSGGLALSVSTAISITNNNTIAGGGGGGGGGGASAAAGSKTSYVSVGGGGGGGRSGATNSSGGSGGQSNNAGSINNAATGGAGTATSQGGGGAPFNDGGGYTGGTGGSGGAWGSSGSGGANGNPYNPNGAPYGGGAGGGAVTGNSNITWVATGTRNGGIS